MASITLDLNQFKSSGIYTVEFDTSQSITLTTQTIRLVVGFSRVGPFNAPVYLQDTKTANQIFGPIDPLLERRGSFFHRALATCLKLGPVFALNIVPINNGQDPNFPVDNVDFRCFSVDVTAPNPAISSNLFSYFFNKQKFWVPDSEALIDVAALTPNNAGSLLSFVNLSQQQMSLIVRKSAVKGFDITATTWFGVGNVPDYIRPFDYISDYFLDVIVVNGDWSNYAKLAIDPVFSRYFDQSGIIKSQLNNFISSTNTSILGSFTGCIIPDLVDGEGRNYYIETIINNNITTTGLLCAVDRDQLDDYANSTHKVDLVGHGLVSAIMGGNQTSIDFLSYSMPIITDYLYTPKPTFTTTNYNVGNGAILTVGGKVAGSGYANGTYTLVPLLGGTGSGAVATLVVASTGVTTVTLTNPGTGYSIGDVLQANSNFDSVGDGSLFTITVETLVPESVLDFPGLSLSSVFLGGNNGIFENVIQIPISSADPVKLAALQSSLVPGSSVVVGTLNGSPANCIVQSVVQSGTSLRVSYSHPSKASEPLNFTNVLPVGIVFPTGSVQGSVVLTGDYTTGQSIIAVGNIILFQKPGFRTYLTVSAVSYSSSTGKTTVTFVELSFAGIDSTCTISSGTAAKVDVTQGLSFIFNPDKFVLNSAVTPHEYNVYQYGQLYADIASGAVKIGDKLSLTGSINEFIYPFATVDAEGLPMYRVKAFTDSTLTSQVNVPTFNSTLSSGGGSTTGLNVISLANSINTDYPIISSDPTFTSIIVSTAVGQSVTVGSYVVSQPTPGVFELTEVIGSVKAMTQSGTFQYTLTTNEGVYINNGNISVFQPIDSFATNYRFTVLNGFQMGAFHLPGTPENESSQLAKILGVIDPAGTYNIAQALSSNNIISFRYIVDTFDGGLNADSAPKDLLTQLALSRQKCMAIVNAPSIKKFTQSTDPIFTDAPDLAAGNVEPTLDTEYIVEGGNLTLGPSFLYSLPSVDSGSQYAGFFSPFLIARTNGKNTLVPPAAYVSNLFVKKFLNGTPYAIVAGTRRGVIDDPEIVGLEYDFLDSDRDNLEPFGINPIVYRKNTGIMVYANQTSYQNITSALNSLHVRDLLITIEEGVEDILSNYVFEFNDASTRLQISSIVQTYLSNVQSDGGIYNYSVVMDATNNTNDIIDQNFGIIDITIEPAKGLQKIINRLTVTRTGGISGGGFTLA